MSYIGNVPTNVAFLTDQFNGNGSLTAFTLSAAPANTNSILVAVSGVLQDPSTYSVSGTTLTFSAAPPAGTGNISVRFLGIPASGVTTTAYRTVTEFTATAGQTTFTPPSYTAGYINVYRNGALLGTADYTATNGTTVVLASAASSGDLVVVESFYVSSVLNAIPATARSITAAYLPIGSVLQVVYAQTTTRTVGSSTSYVDVSGLTASITPNASTNKILVLVNYSLGTASSSGAESPCSVNLVRSSTQVYEVTRAIDLRAATYASESNVYFSGGFTYLDSPATTSSTTYKCQVKQNAAFGRSYDISSGSSPSSITLMEIAA